MNENENLWNTKTSDLTVGDTVKLNLLAPTAVVGGFVLLGAVLCAAGSLARKIRKSPTPINDGSSD